MGKQVFLTEREARNALQRRRDTYFAIEKLLSPAKREQEGNLECIHCRGRFNGITAAAWKFGLCDDCLQR
ncbi:hypothetical protein IG197_11610 [Aminobacter sp. SR38]|jgi:hypothetical protein|uniref:hypothetical protein n=1 Tax=Aminobacter sp. SR38 TaxID=2774562 RepID=UPI0017806B08|nr:hypothetical protein [Aminobacter sp. SR38]QOF73646.1 hypothetical protein IG197_11610 [Aminobacter sp. SR38]